MSRSLLLLLMAVWTLGSWYTYTCIIKGFCALPAEIPAPITVGALEPAELKALQTKADGDEEDETDAASDDAADTEKTEVVVETPKSCDPYLGTNIRYNFQNSFSEVQKLEAFLQDHRDEDVPSDGFYGRDDEAAVMRLQNEYADEVLSPWGLLAPTGNVMSTTRAKINELYCQK